MRLDQDSAAGARAAQDALLDAAAYLGVQALAADSVIIAVGNDQGHWVRGCSGSVGDIWRGRRVVAVERLPRNLVLRVTLQQQPDGAVHVAADDRPPADDEYGSVSWALTSKAVNGWSALVVAAGPPRTSPSALRECLQELLDAAEAAVSASLDGDRHRLRAGLQEREDERRRWARELHDETLQQLGALQVLLTSARRAAGQEQAHDADPLARAVDLATSLLAGQITSLRHLITELRPAALDELGLRAPLEALAERTRALTGLAVEVQASLRYAEGEVSTRLLPDIEVAVYRVVQEALTNVGRHSGASWARVVVAESDGQVCVEIRDNGTGMTKEHSSGFGIAGMRERALLAGGSLEVLSVTDGHAAGPEAERRGTTIRMVVPATHLPPGEDA